jgi:hypothetical protein
MICNHAHQKLFSFIITCPHSLLLPTPPLLDQHVIKLHCPILRPTDQYIVKLQTVGLLPCNQYIVKLQAHSDYA